MYLSEAAVRKSIQCLSKDVHPFFGITFLACKAMDLSVGSSEVISIDKLTHDHLNKYHRIDRKSEFFFQPFKSSGRSHRWVNDRYASTGLQKANTQTFKEVFIHKSRSKDWGFVSDYILKITEILSNNRFPTKVPSWALAVWIFKGVKLSPDIDLGHLLQDFYKKFNITTEEKIFLFDDSFSDLLFSNEEIFSSEPLVFSDVLDSFEAPPDGSDELGRTLNFLKIENSGLAPYIEMNLGERLNLITGDNGLGKSLLLEFAWWAATGTWAHRPALPNLVDRKNIPRVSYSLTGKSDKINEGVFEFDFDRNIWNPIKSIPNIEALGIFARADGSFSVSDPVRLQLQGVNAERTGRLTSEDIWNGKAGLIEGLIRDWVSWEKSDDQLSFDRFRSVLRRLTPEDLGELTPDKSIRIPGDPREIPTIRHKYGVVPIIHASSGVQRILLITYLIIWAWQEHEIASKQVSQEPLRRLIILVDEIEAHLHPKWQRIVLPAIMSIGDLLSNDLSIQMISATHSPMIMASLEPYFDSDEDALFHLDTVTGDVRLENIPFIKYGDASRWLTSPLFGLQHARSREAEKTIELAKSIQSDENPASTEVEEIHKNLKRYLASDDKFWPRWLYFAESHGVAI